MFHTSRMPRFWLGPLRSAHLTIPGRIGFLMSDESSMKLLALDTSGDACSAALLVDGVVHQLLEIAPRRHGELILSMIDGLMDDAGLAPAQLDAVAFGCGPGSFTGVRIAVSVAQGIAFGAGLRTVPVSTLGALAVGEQRRSGRGRILAALDARMGEVYWGAYAVSEDGAVRLEGKELVCAPEDVSPPPDSHWWGVGPGWSVYHDRLAARIGQMLDGTSTGAICEAQDLLPIAQARVRTGALIAPELAQPVYLRDRVTHGSGPRAS